MQHRILTVFLKVQILFSVNSSRGNKYFGECTATSINCVRPANREAASDTETDAEKWAPPYQVQKLFVSLFGMNDISNYALNVEEIISILEFEYNAGI